MPDKQGLYIGDEVLPSSSRYRKIGDPLRLDPADLTTHMFICGASGFGKTILSKSVVEEAALSGIPSIVVDVKGDLASLAIPTAALFHHAADRALLRTVLGEDFDEQVRGATKARQENAYYAARSRRFASKVEVDVFTPKSAVGRPLALATFPRFGRRMSECEPQERQDYQEMLHGFVTAYLSRIGIASRPTRSAAESLLIALLEYAWEEGISLEGLPGVEQLIHWIMVPPVAKIGALTTDLAMDERKRIAFAQQANSDLRGLEKQWYTGEAFDVEGLLEPREGRTPIIVLSLAHLNSFGDQAFVVAQTCYAVYRWMRGKGGTSKPRALLFLDEVGGSGGAQSFFPSYPHSPSSKAALSVLVRQGRAFGVCCLLATQNVIGVDNRGLANCATWAVGDLNSPRERDRLQQTLGEALGQGNGFAARMAELHQGEFLLKHKDGQLDRLRTRWLYSAHRVLNSHSILQLGPLIESWKSTRAIPSEEVVPAAEDERHPAPAAPADEPRPLAATRRVPVADEGSSEPNTDSLSVDDDDGATRTLGSAGRWLLTQRDGKSWPLDVGRKYSLGRHDACDIVIKDTSISRRHLLLDVREDSVVVQADPGMKNSPVVAGRALQGGQSVRVTGPKVSLRVGEQDLVLRLST